MIRAWLLSLLLATAGLPAAALGLRVATYDVDLGRDGPGLLLHELGQEPKPPLATVLAVIKAARPDLLLLCDFDHDLRGQALAAFAARLREGPDGIDYAYSYDGPVNAGVNSGLDLDGDGKRLGWDDALAWGRFPGNGGMALLSRYPVDLDAARSFRRLRWEDLPGAELPTRADGSPFPSAEGRALLPLSSRSHWDVPVLLPDGRGLHLLAAYPTPPLYDGPEKANARRNNDEIAFWSLYLGGTPFADDQGRSAAGPDAPVVVLGDLNADPGTGRRGGALGRLLADPRLQDPGGGPTARFRGKKGPRDLRLDYVLPSRDLTVTGSGVFWPEEGEPLAEAVAAGPAHRLVWVDLDLP